MPPRSPVVLSRTVGSHHSLPLLTLSLCVVVVGGAVLAIASQRWSAAVLVAAAPAVAAVLFSDLRAAARGVRSSFVLPAVIGMMPLLRWFSPGVGGANVSGSTLLAALPWALLLIYAGACRPSDLSAFRRRARVLALPLTGIILATAAAQLATGELWRPTLQLNNAFSLYHVAGMAGFFLLSCFYCSSRERVARLLRWSLIINVVQVAVVLAQKLAPSGGGPFQVILRVNPSGGTVLGLLGDAELTAELMVLLYAWALCFTIWSRTGRQRLGAGVLTGAYLIAALSLTHRTALLGVVGVTILVVALASLGARKRVHWAVLVALLGTLLLMFGSSGLVRSLPSAVVARTVPGTGSVQFFTEGGGFANRESIYVAAGRAVASMPITGYGIEHVKPVSGQAGVAAGLISLHSIWLWSLLSAGIAGLAFTILLYAKLLVCAFRAWFAARSGTSAALLVSVLFLVVDQSKVDAVRLPVYAFFTFALFGMVASYWRDLQVETAARPGVHE